MVLSLEKAKEIFEENVYTQATCELCGRKYTRRKKDLKVSCVNTNPLLDDCNKDIKCDFMDKYLCDRCFHKGCPVCGGDLYKASDLSPMIY